MNIDKSMRECAERNNKLHKTLIDVATKDIKYIGFVCFFRAQSVEMLLRHMLSLRNSQPSTLFSITDLAKQLQARLTQASYPEIDKCAGELGATLTSWDINGRYSPTFAPDLDDLSKADELYAELLQLCNVMETWESSQGQPTDYTSRFASWSEKGND